jgi:hypothetical protein
VTRICSPALAKLCSFLFYFKIFLIFSLRTSPPKNSILSQVQPLDKEYQAVGLWNGIIDFLTKIEAEARNTKHLLPRDSASSQLPPEQFLS